MNGWGAPTGLWLRDHAFRNGADALADQIIEVARAAAELVVDRQALLLNEFGKRSRRIREDAE